jgi:Xaa-Pro aminopeptidase
VADARLCATGVASGRVERLVELLPEEQLDALLITDLINLRYVTGFVGTNGLAVVGPDTRMFATDFRYATQMAEEVDSSFDRRELPRNLMAAIEDVLPAGGLRLGFESSMPVRIHERLRELLPDRVELVMADGLVERLRAVKDRREVERLRAAAEMADRALEQIVGEGLVGRTERDVALALEIAQRRMGAEQVSFEPIVAAGPHGALPHAAPRDVEIAPDQLLVIDWGARVDGYCSDCTRTFATGALDDEATAVYELVQAAQLAGLEAVRAGADAPGVDSVSRQVIAAAGYGERFGHGLGHGVGLDVHEDPRLSQNYEGRLQAGNVVSVEPGIYLPGKFGVRIEDLVVVTDDGCQILTGLSKDLTGVG